MPLTPRKVPTATLDLKPRFRSFKTRLVNERANPHVFVVSRKTIPEAY